MPAWSVTKPLPSVPHNPPLDPGLWRPDGSKPVFSKIASVPIRTRVCLGRVPSVAPAASLALWWGFLTDALLCGRRSVEPSRFGAAAVRLPHAPRVRLASKCSTRRRRCNLSCKLSLPGPSSPLCSDSRRCSFFEKPSARSSVEATNGKRGASVQRRNHRVPILEW